MIYSMTGYGKGSAENKKFSVQAEVKSINSRFLDIYFKAPAFLISKEYEIREFIKSKVNRGKLTVLIQIEKKGINDNALPNVDKEKLKSFLSLIKELKKTAKINEEIKLEHILNNKEIFSVNDVEVSEEEISIIKKALASALVDLNKMKKNEGKELSKDLSKRIKNIEEKLEVVEKEASASVKEYFEKLKEKIKILVEGITEYNDRLEMELALIADKSEITEECVRLRSHLKFFIESIENETDPGRKLNFLCQEMNREANTISSKSLSTTITHNVVLVKEEIEKIREQIQNIE
ncbi:MAG: YicC/YloC family endoribonuclease [Ignavibacteriaceae bacterium]